MRRMHSHLAIARGSELVNHFLLLANDLGVLGDDGAQSLDTIVRLLEAHGYLTVASRARH